jgi:hypothetical protein
MSKIDNHAVTVCAAVAAEIRDVRALIDSLAEVLASDEYLARTYTEQLQSFDLIAQRSEEAAALLDRVAQGSCMVEAVEHVRLNLVQDRLRAALETI